MGHETWAYCSIQMPQNACSNVAPIELGVLIGVRKADQPLAAKEGVQADQLAERADIELAADRDRAGRPGILSRNGLPVGKDTQRSERHRCSFEMSSSYSSLDAAFRFAVRASQLRKLKDEQIP